MNEPGNLPGEIEGQTAEQTQHDPTGPHADQALPGEKGAGRAAAGQAEQTDDRGENPQGHQEGKGGLLLPIVQTDCQSRKHKHSSDGQNLGDKPPHHFVVHSIPLFAGLIMGNGPRKDKLVFVAVRQSFLSLRTSPQSPINSPVSFRITAHKPNPYSL